MIPDITELDVTGFNMKFTKGGDNECWPWTAYRTKFGHGQLNHKGKTVYAHIFAYQLKNGPVADGLCVCHSCDNPWCVNPSHLFLGTRKDNMDDKVKKKRHTVGEASGSILITSEVEEIKRLYATGEYTQTALGRKFGVHQSQINRIINNRRWRHTNQQNGTENAIT